MRKVFKIEADCPQAEKYEKLCSDEDCFTDRGIWYQQM